MHLKLPAKPEGAFTSENPKYHHSGCCHMGVAQQMLFAKPCQLWLTVLFSEVDCARSLIVAVWKPHPAWNIKVIIDCMGQWSAPPWTWIMRILVQVRRWSRKLSAVYTDECARNYSVLPAAGSSYCLKYLEKWKPAFFLYLVFDFGKCLLKFLPY